MDDGGLYDGEGRIPKSAIMSLARVVQTILEAPNIGESFKDYILEIAVRCLSKLPTAGDNAQFRHLLVRALCGGSAISRHEEFASLVWSYYRELDHILIDDTQDLASELEAAVEG